MLHDICPSSAVRMSALGFDALTVVLDDVTDLTSIMHCDVIMDYGRLESSLGTVELPP